MWLAHRKYTYIRRFGATHVQYVCMRLVQVDERTHK